MVVMDDVTTVTSLCVVQEASKRQAQLEFAHTMLLRHHESTQTLEYKHLLAIHRLRDEQQTKQHQTEGLNQREYSKRAKRELKNRHAMEVKQQPKSLKVRAARFANTCR
jgi:thousand and one amino acid protein kinase